MDQYALSLLYTLCCVRSQETMVLTMEGLHLEDQGGKTITHRPTNDDNKLWWGWESVSYSGTGSERKKRLMGGRTVGNIAEKILKQSVRFSFFGDQTLLKNKFSMAECRVQGGWEQFRESKAGKDTNHPSGKGSHMWCKARQSCKERRGPIGILQTSL